MDGDVDMSATLLVHANELVNDSGSAQVHDAVKGYDSSTTGLRALNVDAP
jgi:hypothetical protein